MRFIIIGGNEIVHSYIRLMYKINNMKIIAIVDDNPTSDTISLAKRLKINITHKYEGDLHKHIDYLIYPNKNGVFLDKLSNNINIKKFLRNQEQVMLNDIVATSNIKHSYLQLVCNDLQDGLIIIDDQATIRYVNIAATELVGNTQEQLIGAKIADFIPESMLVDILETRRKELHHTVLLENGTEIITNAFPIINQQNRLEGAYAFLQKKNSIINSAKQYTDYNKLIQMLQTLIHTTHEAVSYVDEFGILKMCNREYARLAGLPKGSLIGRQADLKEFEGNKVHIEVLKSRRAINELAATIGDEFFHIRATPIIIEGKFKGSIATFRNITKLTSIEAELKLSKQIIRKLETTYLFEDIIYQSNEINLIIEQARFAASTQATILLKGGKGTGKALLANAIHNESNRKYNRFIHVKCAVDNQDLVVSTTHAKGGTLFIDEVDCLTLESQQDLLTIMEDKPLDLRIIASTKIDLEQAVKQNEFSIKLLGKINSITISIPDLNDHKTDLELLIHYFINNINQNYGMVITAISDEALEALNSYNWPGNISELENVIEHAAIIMNNKDQVIEINHLQSFLTNNDHENTQYDITKPLQEIMDKYEHDYIKSVYKSQQYNKTKTAKVLGISVRNLYYKIDKYELDEKNN